MERRDAPFSVATFPPFAFGALTTTTTTIANSYISAELKGNKQAEDIKAGMGSLGGLKKSL